MKSINYKKTNDHIISFEGFIDSIEDAATVSEIFDKISKDKPENIIINLEKAEYINSSILGVFMKYYRLMPYSKISIKCCNPYIRDLLRITALDKFFILDPSE
ncbi:MAG: STAS domain-containing protein [Candidatus Muirbacterium halophilum]|nr:STAS domain-containing protein [Candidatus Muirbacterium halophilum]MCK9475706.1 STAS domain-containing protein [Candidatus Muirbacterium halophilum]